LKTSARVLRCTNAVTSGEWISKVANARCIRFFGHKDANFLDRDGVASC
jgi:hypothetical protein